MTRKRKHKKHSKVLSTMFSLVFLLFVGLYLAGGFYYKDHFFPKTTMNGKSIANKTLTQANALLQKDTPKTLFTIKDHGKDFLTLSPKNLGISTDLLPILREVKKEQNPWTFPKVFFTPQKKNQDVNFIQKEKIIAYSKTLESQLEAANKEKKAPQNAKLIFVDGLVQIQPEVLGTQIDSKKVVADFEKALTTENGKKSLDLNHYLVQPKVKKDSPELQKQVNVANALTKIEASYIINDEKIIIPTETILSWIVFDGEKVTLNQELVSAYVNELGKNYNTSSKPLLFSSTKQGQKEVPAGSLGWTIKVNDETAALTEQILKGESFERVPLTVGAGEVKGERIGNTYIEVDLENQHMWYYKDGKLALETDIVSGKPNTPTPKGVFYVWNKERNATLRGLNEDGTKYASPVDYWMPIDWEGVGIHDSNWQPTYGGDWWKQNGSHGCVNTPPNVMKKLYDMIEVGTPVIVL